MISKIAKAIETALPTEERAHDQRIEPRVGHERDCQLVVQDGREKADQGEKDCHAQQEHAGRRQGPVRRRRGRLWGSLLGHGSSPEGRQLVGAARRATIAEDLGTRNGQHRAVIVENDQRTLWLFRSIARFDESLRLENPHAADRVKDNEHPCAFGPLPIEGAATERIFE